ncbi:FHA domain-containing protein [Clostridium felsineum]|uniref:FHA domain-containing protein n=1 Tax=Clostridium felsineum TaxID=36839 RepID=UPI00098C3B82|nr:FHA domain-containing protein [Clostridium felsineum]URZ18070.1 hypothetical protein CLFE_041250 [Clostridium felsineum DSM 794]
MIDYSDIELSDEIVERKFAVLNFKDSTDINKDEINWVNSMEDGIIPMQLKGSEVLYDVTNKFNLESYLKKRKIRAEKLCSLLLNALEELKKIDHISLKSGNIAVEAKFMYINETRDKLFYIYIPGKKTEEFNLEREFKALVKKLIVDVVNIEDNDNFLFTLLRNLREEDFRALEEFIKNHSKGEIEDHNIINDKDININININPKPFEEGNHLEVEVNSNNKNHTQAFKINKEIRNNEPRVAKENINLNKSSIVTPISEPSETFNPRTEFIMDVKNEIVSKPNVYEKPVVAAVNPEIKKFKLKSIFWIVAIQVLVLILFLCVFILFGDYTALKVLTISILLGLDLITSVLIVLNFMKKKNKVTFNNVYSRNTESIGKTSNTNSNTTNNIKMSKREIVSEMSYSTQLINEKFPYLLENKKGVVEKIFINKDSFKVGRLSGSVDYVSDNRAIGKLHAEIRKVNSDYYVMDLESKNGTFINDKRLESNKLYKMKENDIIKFANSYYTFKFN